MKKKLIEKLRTVFNDYIIKNPYEGSPGRMENFEKVLTVISSINEPTAMGSLFKALEVFIGGGIERFCVHKGIEIELESVEVAVGPLLKALKHANPYIRRVAAETAGKRKVSETADALFEILKTYEDINIAVAAALSLSKLKDYRIIEFLENSTDEDYSKKRSALISELSKDYIEQIQANVLIDSKIDSKSDELQFLEIGKRDFLEKRIMISFLHNKNPDTLVPSVKTFFDLVFSIGCRPENLAYLFSSFNEIMRVGPGETKESYFRLWSHIKEVKEELDKRRPFKVSEWLYGLLFCNGGYHSYYLLQFPTLSVAQRKAVLLMLSKSLYFLRPKSAVGFSMRQTMKETKISKCFIPPLVKIAKPISGEEVENLFNLKKQNKFLKSEFPRCVRLNQELKNICFDDFYNQTWFPESAIVSLEYLIRVGAEFEDLEAIKKSISNVLLSGMIITSECTFADSAHFVFKNLWKIRGTGEKYDFKVLKKLLKSGEPEVRFRAIVNLSELNCESLISPLFDILDKDSDWFVRETSAELLAKIGGDGIFKKLSDVLKSNEFFVRRAVVFSLPSFPDEAIIKIFCRHFDDSDEFIRGKIISEFEERVIRNRNKLPDFMKVLTDACDNLSQYAFLFKKIYKTLKYENFENCFPELNELRGRCFTI